MKKCIICDKEIDKGYKELHGKIYLCKRCHSGSEKFIQNMFEDWDELDFNEVRLSGKEYKKFWLTKYFPRGINI